MCVYLSLSLYIYIYIYTYTYLSLSIYIYMYIHIYNILDAAAEVIFVPVLVWFPRGEGASSAREPTIGAARCSCSGYSRQTCVIAVIIM